MAAVSGMRYAAGKKADGNKYEIRNVPYSQSTVWHVFGTALAWFKMSTQRVGILNYNPPASRGGDPLLYRQKSPFRTIIEVSSHYLRKER